MHDWTNACDLIAEYQLPVDPFHNMVIISVIDLMRIISAPPSLPTHTADEPLPNETSFRLTRNLTTKGSRYGTKNPLKRISASDGAKYILDKFSSNGEYDSPPASSKQYYGECVVGSNCQCHS